MAEVKWTPGPWRWEINPNGKSVVLSGGSPKYDLHVLDFVRWGMSGAAPRFLDHKESVGGLMLMERAEAFAVPAPGREHHASWFRLIDHPDARLIESAPDLYAALDDLIDLASAAMSQANGDGAEYDVDGELADARAALAKARGETP